jgi:hypothetical protein
MLHIVVRGGLPAFWSIATVGWESGPFGVTKRPGSKFGHDQGIGGPWLRDVAGSANEGELYAPKTDKV